MCIETFFGTLPFFGDEFFHFDDKFPSEPSDALLTSEKSDLRFAPPPQVEKSCVRPWHCKIGLKPELVFLKNFQPLWFFFNTQSSTYFVLFMSNLHNTVTFDLILNNLILHSAIFSSRVLIKLTVSYQINYNIKPTGCTSALNNWISADICIRKLLHWKNIYLTDNLEDSLTFLS